MTQGTEPTNGSDGKQSACNAEDLGSIPGLGRAPGEGNGNPLQYSCLENPMDRGYSPWGHKEMDTTEQLTLSDIINKKQFRKVETGPNSHHQGESKTVFSPRALTLVLADTLHSF